MIYLIAGVTCVLLLIIFGSQAFQLIWRVILGTVTGAIIFGVLVFGLGLIGVPVPPVIAGGIGILGFMYSAIFGKIPGF